MLYTGYLADLTEAMSLVFGTPVFVLIAMFLAFGLIFVLLRAVMR